MNARTIAALFAAVALPVAAQGATPRVDPPPAPARVQAKNEPAKPATAKERAKLAKKKHAQQKQAKLKKAPAN